MKSNILLMAALMMMSLTIQACLVEEEEERCGLEIAGETFNTVPDAGKFSVVQLDTINKLATLRFSGTEWVDVCTADSVSLTVNAQGQFTAVKACLRWSPEDSTVFEVINTGPVWTGSAPATDISAVYGNGPGILYATVDFTFEYTDSSATLPALHERLSGIFIGMYIDPHAGKYNF